MDPDGRCMNPIENGDIPASYVSLPEGNLRWCSLFVFGVCVFSIHLKFHPELNSTVKDVFSEVLIFSGRV